MKSPWRAKHFPQTAEMQVKLYFKSIKSSSLGAVLQKFALRHYVRNGRGKNRCPGITLQTSWKGLRWRKKHWCCFPSSSCRNSLSLIRKKLPEEDREQQLLNMVHRCKGDSVLEKVRKIWRGSETVINYETVQFQTYVRNELIYLLKSIQVIPFDVEELYEIIKIALFSNTIFPFLRL